MSCGEYGDNIRKLVTAIRNGKNDIRTGKPFPALTNDDEKLNNSGVDANIEKINGHSHNVESCNESPSSTTTNVNLFQPYVTNDITKNSNCEYFYYNFNILKIRIPSVL